MYEQEFGNVDPNLVVLSYTAYVIAFTLQSPPYMGYTILVFLSPVFFLSTDNCIEQRDQIKAKEYAPLIL